MIRPKLRPELPYRRRMKLSEAEFEAITDRTLQDAERLLETAEQDAREMLQALPKFESFPEFGDEEDERYALAYAFMLSFDKFKEKANPFSIIELVNIVISDTNSVRAMARHAPHRQAKEFVRFEWAAHQHAYNHNKSAFARHYVRRVQNEFQVTVTEMQLREVWLNDTPRARKPAGEPAHG